MSKCRGRVGRRRTSFDVSGGCGLTLGPEAGDGFDGGPGGQPAHYRWPDQARARPGLVGRFRSVDKRVSVNSDAPLTLVSEGNSSNRSSSLIYL